MLVEQNSNNNNKSRSSRECIRDPRNQLIHVYIYRELHKYIEWVFPLLRWSSNSTTVLCSGSVPATSNWPSYVKHGRNNVCNIRPDAVYLCSMDGSLCATICPLNESY